MNGELKDIRSQKTRIYEFLSEIRPNEFLHPGFIGGALGISPKITSTNLGQMLKDPNTYPNLDRNGKGDWKFIEGGVSDFFKDEEPEIHFPDVEVAYELPYSPGERGNCQICRVYFRPRDNGNMLTFVLADHNVAYKVHKTCCPEWESWDILPYVKRPEMIINGARAKVKRTYRAKHYAPARS